jgi:hypothetical protein
MSVFRLMLAGTAAARQSKDAIRHDHVIAVRPGARFISASSFNHSVCSELRHSYLVHRHFVRIYVEAITQHNAHATVKTRWRQSHSAIRDLVYRRKEESCVRIDE